MSELKLTHTYRLYTLLLLKECSRHGYEIIDKIEEMTGDKPSTSHIYPFLSKLEENGYITSEKGSRGKKTYKLTDDGEKFVSKQLSSFGKMIYAAVQDRVKECSHCDCKIYDDGHREDEEIYCCEHCAEAAKA